MNKKILPFLVLSMVIFLAMNYFPKKTPAEEMNTTQDPEDVVVVSNPKNPESKMRIAFKEELSIGEIEGDENYMFGNFIAFNTDEEGNFYVSDPDNNRILKYDPNGKYLLTIGREGQGPGEFQSLSVAKFDKDNNLYITDIRNQKISFFDKDGKFLHHTRMLDRYENLSINSRDIIIAIKTDISQEANVQKTARILSLFDDKFNSLVELYKDEMEIPLPTGRDVSSLGRYLADGLSIWAFRPRIRYALAKNDFIYFGYPDKYEIKIYSPKGKLAKKITRDYKPIEVNEKDKEIFVEVVEEAFSTPSFTDDIKEIAFKKIKYPKYKPAYQSFSLMENGWLAVIVDSRENEYTLFDIFDQEGRYIAHFKATVPLFPAEGFEELQFFFKTAKLMQSQRKMNTNL